jgi:predicted transglutaminase-like cysteine proteinase
MLVLLPVATGSEPDKLALSAARHEAAGSPSALDGPRDSGKLTVGGATASGEQPIEAASLSEPFGLAASPIIDGELLTKWAALTADIGAERDVLRRCREGSDCPPAARHFLSIVGEGRAHEGRARIGAINRAINLAIRPMSDLAQWGVPDRWTAPLATLTSGLGDCEDYAIAKYVALIEAGTDPQDVKLVIVRDHALGEDHAVAVARTEGRWIVLDNRRMTLVEDRELHPAVPLFALDSRGVRMFWHTSPYNVASARAPLG